MNTDAPNVHGVAIFSAQAAAGQSLVIKGFDSRSSVDSPGERDITIDYLRFRHALKRAARIPYQYLPRYGRCMLAYITRYLI